MLKFYCEEAGRALAELKSTPDGLTDAEAARRLAEKGPNKLAEGKKVTTLQRFLQQLSDPMIIILLVAAAVSGVTAAYSGESFADVFIILIVVLINAVLGVYQESKAEKAIEALQEMTAATSKVIRGGKQVSLKSEELVPGDVVVLEAGDAVPADGRILESASLKIEEAALTGESVPVNKVVSALGLDDGKDVPLGDRKNMAYMGSTVVYGRGRVLITGTGMDTEMGKIAGALAQAEEGQTPLQKKLAQLSKILSWLVLGICVFIFAFSLIKAGDFHLDVIISTFMVAVSLAVAAIPEGLATVVTIVLSIGVTNMSKRNAVIRRLTAVETLGCAQVICSDKTGTLTQNKMTVVEHVGEEEPLARAMSLCSDAKPGENGDAEGEPTECALVNYATGVGLPKGTLEAAQPRVGEAPFDSGRKMMSTVHENNGAYIQYTKGAPDVVLSRCTSYAKDGKILPMTEEARAEILRQNKQMADKALRVLCAASREWPQLPPDFEPDTLEHDLTFLGLTGMIDPIRPEVKDAITECRQAGIRPIMITGDHKDTAIAIAKQLGIIETADEAITGAELNDISDDRFAEVIGRYSVYARVQPEHKVRIVNAWRKNGFVTAMTGDGVNDAPSIKSADIGIGMGITGTDVTKNVADMVLADDNFATIVQAVKNGRNVYTNIKKAIQFLLSGNTAGILTVLYASLAGLPVPFAAVHLLFINLLTDSLPAIALGLEPHSDAVMQEKPRPRSEGILTKPFLLSVGTEGLVIALATIIAFHIGLASGGAAVASTMAFATLCLSRLFHGFNCKSGRPVLFTRAFWNNKFLLGAFAVGALLLAAVLLIPPLEPLFQVAELSIGLVGCIVGLAFGSMVVIQVLKAIRSMGKK